jgi:hypothetical protein
MRVTFMIISVERKKTLAGHSGEGSVVVMTSLYRSIIESQERAKTTR